MRFSVEKLKSELDRHEAALYLINDSPKKTDALNAIAVVRKSIPGNCCISAASQSIIDQALVSAGVLIDWEICHV